MENKKLVSVIIPVFNIKEYIKYCIELVIHLCFGGCHGKLLFNQQKVGRVPVN